MSLGIAAVIGAVIAIVFVLSSEKTLLIHPKGLIARSQLHLISTNIFLMLLVVIPTFILLFVILWKYRSKNAQAKHDSEYSPGIFKEIILWLIPAVIVVVMACVTWEATHRLDPYQPLKSDVEPLTIQVVALDWKWLFIYPKQGIASLNFVQFPEATPIHFILSADGSPMNSFWIPQLSGQIYCMTGMSTQLHMMADQPGIYSGRAAEINGQGFADMTFIAQSTSQSDFDNWVAYVKQSPLELTESVYSELVQRSRNHPIALYSHVGENLFNHIVMKYSTPAIK